jgi:hypothetical protein
VSPDTLDEIVVALKKGGYCADEWVADGLLSEETAYLIEDAVEELSAHERDGFSRKEWMTWLVELLE